MFYCLLPQELATRSLYRGILDYYYAIVIILASGNLPVVSTSPVYSSFVSVTHLITITLSILFSYRGIKAKHTITPNIQ